MIVELETVEVYGKLDDGTAYHYWTFNGKVPGPFVRVRVGDTVEVRMKNADSTRMMHNVDFHAVTGPGGGAARPKPPRARPRASPSRRSIPASIVYHCATPPVAQHIANGMYGLILVEPEGGLPKVDREFYVMQGEIYTEEAFGTQGRGTDSYEKLLNERPEYYVFNGAVGALSTEHPLKAKVGETVRHLLRRRRSERDFVVPRHRRDLRPRLRSRVADRSPLTDVQTITVPPGGAAIVEFKVEVPGNYMLVDHALSRPSAAWSAFSKSKVPRNSGNLFRAQTVRRVSIRPLSAGGD